MKRIKMEIAGKELVFESGRLANQADSSVFVKYGDTAVLSTVVANEPKEKRDFLPLIVDYREQTYSAGKIPGGFFKREGKPRDREILYGRAIDRTIRPLFPERLIEDIQITVFLLSYDKQQEGNLLGILGTSCALALSDIPWEGPIGAVRVGMKNGELLLNPDNELIEKGDLDLLIAGKDEEIVMVETQAREISEALLLRACDFAIPHIQNLIEIQKEMVKGTTKRKGIFLEIPEELIDKIRKNFSEDLKKGLFISEKKEKRRVLKELKEKILEKFLLEYPEQEVEIEYAIETVNREIVRKRTINSSIRMDGRTEKEIRPITCEVGVLPRTHGSGIFKRGETQSLVVTTLGTQQDEQRLSEMEYEETKRFILHYNFPPFSTGEVKPIRGPSRREIGHGELAERALEPLIELDEKFPYTIRVVSDILESNGSSSMATVCGGSLSLMDAGVPIKSQVAGISIGLMEEEGKVCLLTDIIGEEDHYGDMDFKVAGTRKGITAIQLDLKRKGLPLPIFREALERAKQARHLIIDIMNKVIPKPREKISEYAPQVVSFSIPKEKIGEVIGPGGKNIRRIIDLTGVEINIDDKNSQILIYGEKIENVEKAKEMIESHIIEIEEGRIYTGRVVRIAPFGAFVEVAPGKIGLVHISELSDDYVKDVKEVVQLGDKISVKVLEIDESGKFRLSRKRAMPHP